MAAQDVAYRNLVDMMADLGQGSLDAAVAPRRVFLGNTHDELVKLLIDSGSPWRFVLLLPSNLLAINRLYHLMRVSGVAMSLSYLRSKG